MEEEDMPRQEDKKKRGTMYNVLQAHVFSKRRLIFA
jgi:hypothetical protein